MSEVNAFMFKCFKIIQRFEVQRCSFAYGYTTAINSVLSKKCFLLLQDMPTVFKGFRDEDVFLHESNELSLIPSFICL